MAGVRGGLRAAAINRVPSGDGRGPEVTIVKRGASVAGQRANLVARDVRRHCGVAMQAEPPIAQSMATATANVVGSKPPTKPLDSGMVRYAAERAVHHVRDGQDQWQVHIQRMESEDKTLPDNLESLDADGRHLVLCVDQQYLVLMHYVDKKRKDSAGGECRLM